MYIFIIFFFIYFEVNIENGGKKLIFFKNKVAGSTLIGNRGVHVFCEKSFCGCFNGLLFQNWRINIQ